MIQIRSRLDVADNTGARMATMIGVIGKRTLVARVGDVITANVKEAATGGTVTVSAAGVAYGSNVINLSGYSSPITAFNLTIDNNAQLYLFAPGVSVNTTSTATVKFTNPTPIASSNVLFHVTKIMNAGFSVVNAIVVD